MRMEKLITSLCCQVLFDDSIDNNGDETNGGGSINADVLPRNGSNGCEPVYPYMWPRVNNIFTVCNCSAVVPHPTCAAESCTAQIKIAARVP